MNAPGDNLQRRKTQAIAAAFGLNLAFGILIAHSLAGSTDLASMEASMAQIRGSGLNLLYQAVTLAVCFTWLHFDSRQLDIRRPWWLNLGVIFLKVLFIPYYLFKTRAANQRGSAILAFFGLYFGAIFAMAFGAAFAMMFGFAPMPPAPHAQGL